MPIFCLPSLTDKDLFTLSCYAACFTGDRYPGLSSPPYIRNLETEYRHGKQLCPYRSLSECAITNEM